MPLSDIQRFAPAELWKVSWKTDSGIEAAFETPMSFRDSEMIQMLLRDYYGIDASPVKAERAC